MAEIGDVKRFENNKQLNAYAGIDIRRFQSGKPFIKIKLINAEISIYANYCTLLFKT